MRKVAETGTRIDHPGMVGVLDTGMTGRKQFLVMQYTEGETLRALIKRGLNFARAAGEHHLPVTSIIERDAVMGNQSPASACPPTNIARILVASRSRPKPSAGVLGDWPGCSRLLLTDWDLRTASIQIARPR